MRQPSHSPSDPIATHNQHLPPHMESKETTSTTSQDKLNVDTSITPGSFMRTCQGSKDGYVFDSGIRYNDPLDILSNVCFGNRPILDTTKVRLALELSGYRKVVKGSDGVSRLVLGSQNLLKDKYGNLPETTTTCKNDEITTLQLARWEKGQETDNPELMERIEKIVDPKAENWVLTTTAEMQLPHVTAEGIAQYVNVGMANLPRNLSKLVRDPSTDFGEWDRSRMTTKGAQENSDTVKWTMEDQELYFWKGTDGDKVDCTKAHLLIESKLAQTFLGDKDTGEVDWEGARREFEDTEDFDEVQDDEIVSDPTQTVSPESDEARSSV